MAKRRMPEKQRKAAKRRKKYEAKVLERIKGYIKTIGSPVILEVGAHIGRFIGFVYDNRPEAKVYAVEPLASNIKMLTSKFPKKDIQIFQGAVCSEPGPIEMFISRLETKYKNVDCSLYKGSAEKNNAGIKKSLTVKGETMGNIIKGFELDKINVLSINCEGGEYDMFESEDLSYLDNVDMIYLHLHTKCDLFLSQEYVEKREAINEELYSRGFKCTGMTDLKALAHIVQLWSKV